MAVVVLSGRNGFVWQKGFRVAERDSCGRNYFMRQKGFSVAEMASCDRKDFVWRIKYGVVYDRLYYLQVITTDYEGHPQSTLC